MPATAEQNEEWSQSQVAQQLLTGQISGVREDSESRNLISCTCTCGKDQHHSNNTVQDETGEWEVVDQELLHVEINGIFQDAFPAFVERRENGSGDYGPLIRFVGLDTLELYSFFGQKKDRDVTDL